MDNGVWYLKRFPLMSWFQNIFSLVARKLFNRFTVWVLILQKHLLLAFSCRAECVSHLVLSKWTATGVSKIYLILSQAFFSSSLHENRTADLYGQLWRPSRLMELFFYQIVEENDEITYLGFCLWLNIFCNGADFFELFSWKQKSRPIWLALETKPTGGAFLLSNCRRKRWNNLGSCLWQDIFLQFEQIAAFFRNDGYIYGAGGDDYTQYYMFSPGYGAGGDYYYELEVMTTPSTILLLLATELDIILELVVTITRSKEAMELVYFLVVILFLFYFYWE